MRISIRKPLDEWDEEDLKQVLAIVQRKVRNGEYTENTAYEYKKTLRKFSNGYVEKIGQGLKFLEEVSRKTESPFS